MSDKWTDLESGMRDSPGLLVLALLVLFISGCATHGTRRFAHGSDAITRVWRGKHPWQHGGNGLLDPSPSFPTLGAAVGYVSSWCKP